MNGKKNKLTVDPPSNGVHDWMLGLRAALFDAVTEGDVTEIAKGLVAKAKAGDMAATKLLLTYMCGGGMQVKQTIIIENADDLPKVMARMNHERAGFGVPALSANGKHD